MKEIDKIYESLLFSIPKNNLGMEYKYGFQHGVALFKKAIDNSIVSSGQMRKKGHWKMEPDPYGFFEEIPVCSECGRTTEMRKTYDFCPNCGADMRGEQDE